MPNAPYARLTAQIAFAPRPPEGYGYLYRTDAPPSHLRALRRSPYAPFLSIHTNGEEIYLVPHTSPDFPPDHLPYAHSPADGPLPPLRPLPPDPATDTRTPIQIERDEPTGAWFRLPDSAATNLHYYRTTYPDAEIVRRQDRPYARFPAPDTPRSPHAGVTYEDPPPSARHAFDPYKRDTPPDPATAHVYLKRHVRPSAAPSTYEVQGDVDDPSNRFYIQVPVRALYDDPTLRDFTAEQAHSILYHPEGFPTDPPTFPGRYTPLTQTTAPSEEEKEARNRKLREQGG